MSALASRTTPAVRPAGGQKMVRITTPAPSAKSRHISVFSQSSSREW
ncbi:TPA: hypothetical protein TXT63_000810 [Streptococcus suis]|nr:hypothetical protein [Streptococcus suis]